MDKASSMPMPTPTPDPKPIVSLDPKDITLELNELDLENLK